MSQREQQFAGDSSVRALIRQAAERIEPAYLTSKRWFGGKSRPIQGCRVVDVALLQEHPEQVSLLLLEVAYADAEADLYQVPLVLSPPEHLPSAVKNDPHGVAFVLPTAHGELCAYDAFVGDVIGRTLYEGMYDDTEWQLAHGRLVCHHRAALLDTRLLKSIVPISTEQSNTSVVYNEKLILKTFRKLAAGVNPDFEIPYYLTTHTDFTSVPRVAGFIDYQPDEGQAVSLGVLQEFVANQGDCYTTMVAHTRDYFKGVVSTLAAHPVSNAAEQAALAMQLAGPVPGAVRRLGYTTGLLHNALASPTTLPEFQPEVITDSDAARWEESIRGLIERVGEAVRQRMGALPVPQQALLRPMAGSMAAFLEIIRGLDVLARQQCHKIRCHGDYHLGQVLQAGQEFVILDFEGEPARDLTARRAKQCPLRDVAGMLRSFDYVAYAVLFEVWDERRAQEAERADLESWARAWERLARAAFLEGYGEATGTHAGPRYVPAEEAGFQRVLDVFEVEKAFYELNYEFNNRPSWIPIPAQGLWRILRDRSMNV